MAQTLAPRIIASAQEPITAPIPIAASSGVDPITRSIKAVPSMSCVLPRRNEALKLARLLPRLLEEASALVQTWEAILVDDGSTATWS